MIAKIFDSHMRKDKKVAVVSPFCLLNIELLLLLKNLYNISLAIHAHASASANAW